MLKTSSKMKFAVRRRREEINQKRYIHGVRSVLCTEKRARARGCFKAHKGATVVHISPQFSAHKTFELFFFI